MPTPTPPSNQPLELHPDPITGEPGSHPVATGVGAAAGGVTGAAVGMLGGPLGIAVGAFVGAFAGGLAGKEIAESIDPSAEDAFWREHHRDQSYATGEQPFDAFAPAYRAGYTGFREGQTFDEREADLRMEYEGGPQKADAEAEVPSTEKLHWDEARAAARAAYERVQRGEAAKRTAD